MPTLPATDGLPIWAQVLISILVCIATLAVAFKGYFGPKTSNAARGEAATTATITAATLMDNMTMRVLADSIVSLNAAVLQLTNAVNENTHHERNSVDTEREVCRRLRDLTEQLERMDRGRE